MLAMRLASISLQVVQFPWPAIEGPATMPLDSTGGGYGDEDRTSFLPSAAPDMPGSAPSFPPAPVPPTPQYPVYPSPYSSPYPYPPPPHAHAPPYPTVPGYGLVPNRRSGLGYLIAAIGAVLALVAFFALPFYTVSGRFSF